MSPFEIAAHQKLVRQSADVASRRSRSIMESVKEAPMKPVHTKEYHESKSLLAMGITVAVAACLLLAMIALAIK